MSLLLEALQKADQERRQNGTVPGIDSEHAIREQAETERAGHRPVLGLLLGLIVCLLLYLVYLQLSQKPADTQAIELPAPVQPARNDQPDQPDQRIDASMQAETRPTSPERRPTRPNTVPQQNSAEEVAALYQQTKQHQQTKQPPKTDPAPIPADTPAQTLAQPGIAPAPALPDDFLPQEPSADDLYERIPFASQLTGAEQSAIPPLRYTTHGYAPETGLGVVTLNGRSYRRGDTVAAGLVLLEIKADYIVMDNNGTVFRLPAATDWSGR